MGMLQRIGRFVVGGRSAIEDPAAVLRQAYLDAGERMALLRQHAELAPQEHSRDGLANLAQGAAAQVERIRNVLRERGIGLIPERLPAASRSANHWERLVEDLKRHQSSSAWLRDRAVELADSHPAVSEFLDQLCREDIRTCERLRGLIARADPQALN